MTLPQWLHAYGQYLPPQAVPELIQAIEGPPTVHGAPAGEMSERAVDQRVELAGASVGGRLWRNNNGVAFDTRGVPIRFGLFNDSARMNKRIKSPDRVGPIPITIGPQHMGRRLGVFFGVEVKRAQWRPGEDKAREEAQGRGLNLINSLGGVGIFASHPDHFLDAVEKLKAGG